MSVLGRVRDATPHPSAPRGRRRALAAAIVLLAGIWGAIAFGRGASSALDPESVVRDYVTLLVNGKAQAATDQVAPDATLGRVVPALLGDAGLALSTSSIRLDRVADRTPAGSDEAVVAVDYTLVGDDGSIGQSSTASLHLVKSRRFLVLTRWQLIDGLARPVAIRSNIPSLPLTIGTTPVPVLPETAPPGSDPGHQVLLYPGTYPLGGTATPWLTADAVITAGAVPQNITFVATSALRTRVEHAVTETVQACAAAGADMPASCPSGLRGRRDRGALSITRPAQDLTIFADATWQTHDPTGLLLSVLAMRPGRFAFTGAGGIPAGESQFGLNAGVLLTPDAHTVIRIETWAEPYPPQ